MPARAGQSRARSLDRRRNALGDTELRLQNRITRLDVSRSNRNRGHLFFACGGGSA